MTRWLPMFLLLVLQPLSACDEKPESSRLKELAPGLARVIVTNELPDSNELVLRAILETPVRVVTKQRFATDRQASEFLADVQPDDDYKISIEVTRPSGQVLDVCHDYIPLAEGDVVALVVSGVPAECAILHTGAVL